MAPQLELNLLGNVEILLDGTLLTGFRSSKCLALLCYLAVTGRSHQRAALAGLLWGDASESHANASLRQSLSNLRKLVGAHLKITRHTAAFDQNNPYKLDVERFETGASRSSTGPALQPLQQAIELYRGDFMAGFHVRDALEFEEWLLTRRARLRRQALQGLYRLSVHYTHQDEAGRTKAIDYTSRLLAMEPWREEAHRQLMLLLALDGQRGAALAQYETCRQLLADELQIDPRPETTALYQRIRAGRLDKPAAESPAGAGPTPPSFLAGQPAVAGPTSPPFVGREPELAQLDRFLELMLTGRRQVAFVTGEAGCGKSALVQAFARRAQARYADLVVTCGECHAHTGQGDPYLPFRTMLSLLAGDVEARWQAGTLPRPVAERLWRLMPYTVQALVSDGPDLIDSFVSGPALLARVRGAPDRSPAWLTQLEKFLAGRKGQRGPISLKQRDLFEQYSRVLETLASRTPLLLLVDDLEWADAGSIDLLFQLGRGLQNSRIMIVGTYRPADIRIGWTGAGSGQRQRHPLESLVNEFQRRFGEIQVNLRQSEDKAFVEALLDTQPNRLGPAFREALYRQTQGHPLFTLEMLRGLQARGDLIKDAAGRWVEGPALDWHILPARIEGVVSERVSRLPPSLREALRIASVEGEFFTGEVVARVQGKDVPKTIRQLSTRLDQKHRLVRSQGSVRLEAGGQLLSHYKFRHSLFQKYLYDHLDETERIYLHQAVGNTLEQLYDDHAGEIAVRLARHFQRAGVVDKAVDYLQQAGDRACQVAAYQEAVGHFKQALSLLASLPANAGRTQQELDLQVGLGTALSNANGHSTPEVKQVFDRARQLCAQVGDTPRINPVLHGLFKFYILRAELDTTVEVADQILRLAKQQGPEFMLPAQLVKGISALYRGQFVSARVHFERCDALDDPRHYQAHQRMFGQNGMVAALANGALNLWYLGFPDQARQRSEAAIALARESAHPYDLTYTAYNASWLHQLRREVQPAQEYAEAAIDLSAKYGLTYWLATATILRGWSLAGQNQAKEGIEQMRQALADLQEIGAAFLRPYFLGLLAEAYAKNGQVDKALAAVTEGLARVERTEERHYEAALYHLKGSLLLTAGSGQQQDELSAEGCFQKAIDAARQQKAGSLELRAATGLGRLWQQQGRKEEEARQMLAEVYGRFGEGFETKDLQAAKTLLANL